MEKRFYLGLGIMALFLILGFFSTFAMNRVTAPIVESLETAAEETAMDKSISLAQQAREAWKDSWHQIALVADHEPLDEIDGLFAQMELHGAVGDDTAFRGYCARLAELVEAVADAHRLNWWNLL